VGLFGVVNNGGVVKNLGVVNADIEGGFRSGIVVGFVNNGTIKNVFTTGSITSNQPFLYIGNTVGGVAGRMYDSLLSNSYSTAVVHGTDGVGGLVGILEQGSVIENSAALNAHGGCPLLMAPPVPANSCKPRQAFRYN